MFGEKHTVSIGSPACMQNKKQFMDNKEDLLKSLNLSDKMLKRFVNFLKSANKTNKDYWTKERNQPEKFKELTADECLEVWIDRAE